ncbi:MAG: hypothetical protein L3J75_17290 [Methylococcaceae bacterium]|nr:hypothetical protein [Methylococcaceae bacterium]
MDWQEINCLIEALTTLVEKYQIELENQSIDDDTRSDISNDLAYTQILLGDYKKKRDQIAS